MCTVYHFNIDFDLWAFIEALSAIVMAVFTWHLLRVSRAQKVISDQQRQIMAGQNEALFEMERGRLCCEDAYIANDQVLLTFKNTGRSHIILRGYDYLGCEVPYTELRQLDWRKSSNARLSKTIAPGDSWKESTKVPWDYWVDGKGRPVFTIAFRGHYVTLGKWREHQWAWVFTIDKQSTPAIRSGGPWIGFDFEYDIAKQEQPPMY